MEIEVKELLPEHIEECVDLYIKTFSQEPWYDVFESKEKVTTYFENFLSLDSFIGFIAVQNNKIVALSVGMKKPWMEGVEYYIDEFCVDFEVQGKGIGTHFLIRIEQELSLKGIKGMLLNTAEQYPSFEFYRKNGFSKLESLVVLGK